MILQTEKLRVNTILIVLSFFFSLIFFNDQVAVNGGLAISKEVEYLGDISPLKFYFLNSWTLITQLAAIFLKIGLSTKITSLVIVFLLTLMLFFSCFFLLNKYLKDFYLSISLTVFLIFFQKNLGDTDYPSLIFTIHTFGAYAQAFVGLITTCLILNKFKLSIFLSFLLLAIHPIVGFWVLSIILFLFLIFKNIKNLSEFIKIISPGLIVLLISVSFYLYFKLENVSYDQSLFDIYMNKWDGHRAKTGEVHFVYIIKSLVVLCIINLFLPKKNKNKISFWFVNLLISSSILVYLLFKFTAIGSFGIFSTIIPGRLMSTYTFIAWPLTLALIYNKLQEKKYIKEFFYILIIIYSITHYKNFILINKSFSNVQILFFKQNQNNIFYKLEKLKTNGNIITTENSSFNTMYISKKPILLFKSIDYLPYHPYLVNDVAEILNKVYGYDFNNPPIKHYPYLNDNFFKETFENRDSEDWRKIKEKFNSNYIVVPKNWNLKLDLFLSDEKFNIFRIT